VTHSPAGDRLNVLFRAYKGHVITSRGFERLPGEPAVYEVSCPFPEGLSGAPVLLTVKDTIAVVAVVIGTDTVTYGGVDNSVGIALMVEEIVGLVSPRLGGPIATQLNLSGAVLGIDPSSRRGMNG